MVSKPTRVLLFGLVLVMLGFSGTVIYSSIFLHFFRIPSVSMSNTIIRGDHLVVKTRAFGDITRGDLIVFRYPDEPSTYYLARVIGLPNETLAVRGKLIYVNDKLLEEQRVTVRPDEPGQMEPMEELSAEGSGDYRVFYFAEYEEDEYPYGGPEPFLIPDNQYFVMGDNRDNSRDSRYRGPVPRSLVFGKPTMIYWSEHEDASGAVQTRWDRLFTKVK
ncbi:MAG TPA: signal peptidase I [Pyrinomonadaceae bacterium]|nr:signal peptidase I [Pyrinomonadaceae bacterium]